MNSAISRPAPNAPGPVSGNSDRDAIPPTLRVVPLRDSGVRPAARENSGLTDIIETGRLVLETARRVAEDLKRSAGASPEGQDPGVSFRKLAKLQVLPMGASSMWRAAAIYRLAQKHRELYFYRHLGVAHLAPLLRLEGPLQLAVLRRAESRKWSRRRLENRLQLIERTKQAGRDPLVDYYQELLPHERPTGTPAAPPGRNAMTLRPTATPARTPLACPLRRPGAGPSRSSSRSQACAGPANGLTPIP